MKKLSAFRTSVFVLATLIATFCAPVWSRGAVVVAWGKNPVLSTGANDVKVLSASYSHSLALRSDGVVVAWGDNDLGQTSVPAGLSGVKAIAAGYYHSLAVKADGTTVAWGYNALGQTNVPASVTNVVAVAGGGYHSLALKADGSIVGWGYNGHGETTIPADATNVVAIAAGFFHSLALRADGRVVGWGNNLNGEINVPGSATNVVALASSENYSLALRSDGTIVGWGYDSFGQLNIPAQATNVVAIAAGSYHCLALRADGTIVGWGRNDYGQANLPPGLPPATGIAAGRIGSLALVAKFDGQAQIIQNPESQGIPYTSNVTFSVVATGWQPMTYQWLFNGTPISAGHPRASGMNTATLSISNLQFSDIGTYAVIVSNGVGAVISSGAVLTVISPPFITQQPEDRTVPAGSSATFSAAASGTPPLRYQWYFNGTNLPGATNTTLTLTNIQPEMSGLYLMQVTNLYGTMQTIPARLAVPPIILRQPTNQVAPIRGSVLFAVDAGGSSSLSYQWRFNGLDIPNATNATLVLSNLSYDQIGFYNVTISNGFGTTNSAKAFLNVAGVFVWSDSLSSFIPTNLPPNLTNAIAVAAGYYHVLTLGTDAKIATWGRGNDFLTLASLTNVPASVTNVVAIAAGGNCSMVLRSNGTVVAWGNNNFIQTNIPAGLSNVVAIAVGGTHCLAVKANATVTAWGNNTSGQATVPTGLSNVVAVAAGDAHSLALKADGVVIGWGNNANGQANTPAGLSNVIALASGGDCSLALRSNGTVTAWGANYYGQTNVPSGLSNVVAIATGTTTCIALKQDGTVVTWGFTGQKILLPELTNTIAVTAGGLARTGFEVALVGSGVPAITLQPYSQIVNTGATVRLHARAAGVPPMTYQWQLENQNLPGATNASLLITNAQGKDTGNYRMTVSNPLGTVASGIATLTIPYNTNLAAALNTNNWYWSDGRPPTIWFAQIRETHDGDVAAQSGAISHSQQAGLQTTITGPGTLTFWWKVSSEENFDFLQFYLDNAAKPLTSISGEKGWEQKTFIIPAGGHTLRWTYLKDASVSAGRDAGWLDEVFFTPDPPVVTQQPLSQSVWMGTNILLQVSAAGVGPFSYQWLNAGTNLPGASFQSLTLTNVTRRNSGVYAVRVSNAGGSTLSSNATLVVHVPQRLQIPVRLADGSCLVTSGDADGGVLLPEDLTALELQVSTNLVNWSIVPGVPVLTDGSFMLHDSVSTNFPVRFYRMVEH